MSPAKVREFFFSDGDLKLQIPTIARVTNTIQLTQFDRELQASWKQHMKLGHFRYDFEAPPESRLLKGSHGFILQYNPRRASQRRAPQAMLHLEQTFNHDKFNFTKIDEEKEVIFQLRRLDGDVREKESRDLLIINVSPLEFGASLLVPAVDSCLPQVLTLYSIRLAIRTVLLSGVKNLKAAFNSLCAFASVNHLHWHLYYLQNHELKLEKIAAKKISSSSDCYEVSEKDYPAPCWAFQIRYPGDINRVSESVHKLTHFLTKSNTGHNVFMTRGRNFDKPENEEIEVLRIFVWSRNKIVGTKDPGAFVMAVCELAGQVLLYEEDKFKTLDEDGVSAAQIEAVRETHMEKREAILGLFTGKS